MVHLNYFLCRLVGTRLYDMAQNRPKNKRFTYNTVTLSKTYL